MHRNVWSGVLLLSLGIWSPNLWAQPRLQQPGEISLSPAGPPLLEEPPPFPVTAPDHGSDNSAAQKTEEQTASGEKNGDSKPSVTGPATDAPQPGWPAPPYVPGPAPAPAPPGPCFYAKAEFLWWGTSTDHVPVLATTGPVLFGSGGVPSSGIPGVPGTQNILGGSGLGHRTAPGLRLTAGWYTDGVYDNTFLEVSGLYLPQGATTVSASSDRFPVLARPFFDSAFNRETAELTAFPGRSQGILTVRADSNLWGLETNYKCIWCCDPACGYRINLLAGLRYLNLEDDILLSENIQAVPGAAPVLGYQSRAVRDRFQTVNQYYAIQLGAEAEYCWGRWTVTARGKFGFGVDQTSLKIEGEQALFTPTGGARAFLGGLLALPNTIDVHHRDAFAVLPEFGFDVGYQLTSHLRSFLGYNFLYLSNLARAGQQIDTSLDSTQIPNFLPPGTVAPRGANHARPAVLLSHETDFWAQGLTLGMEFRY